MIAPDAGCTNADFTKAMGTVMNRPTLLPFPSFAVSLLFGEMGEEVLLGGTRATPKKLLDSGFQFLHPTVEDTVRSAIVEEKKI
jgi:NAD dependent epimerase/dehydratase family enzyme